MWKGNKNVSGKKLGRISSWIWVGCIFLNIKKALGIKEKLLKMKESGINSFENSQTFQRANNSKIKKWLLSKEHI